MALDHRVVKDDRDRANGPAWPTHQSGSSTQQGGREGSPHGENTARIGRVDPGSPGRQEQPVSGRQAGQADHVSYDLRLRASRGRLAIAPIPRPLVEVPIDEIAGALRRGIARLDRSFSYSRSSPVERGVSISSGWNGPAPSPSSFTSHQTLRTVRRRARGSSKGRWASRQARS